MDEPKLRNRAHREALLEKTPNETRRLVQCLNRSLHGFRIQIADKYLGVRKVPAHLDIGNRDYTDTRVLDFATNDIRELALELRLHTPGPVEFFRHTFPEPILTGTRVTQGNPKDFGVSERLGANLFLFEGTCDFRALKHLDIVVNLDVVVLLHADTAFGTRLHLTDVILVTTQ